MKLFNIFFAGALAQYATDAPTTLPAAETNVRYFTLNLIFLSRLSGKPQQYCRMA